MMALAARWLPVSERACQGLAGFLVLGLAWQGWALAQPPAPAAAVPPTLESAWLTPPSSALTARFDRLAPPAPPAPAAAPLAAGPTAPKLRLQGILFGQSPKAYLVDETTNQTVTVRTGDQLGAVTIREIHDRHIVIEQEGESYELRL